MTKLLTVGLLIGLLVGLVPAQKPPPQKPKEEVAPEDVVRITTELVQTDVVVTDKNDQIIPDLKLEDFEVYDNGKKQDLRFLEFVGVDAGRRTQGTKPVRPAKLEADVADVTNELSAKDVKRVIAFVVDDLTIPTQDLPSVRAMLFDFVDRKMRDGDLAAIVRVVGGKGLLQQLTSDRQLLRRAIASIVVTSHPFAVSNTPEPERVQNPLAPTADDNTINESLSVPEIDSPDDEVNRLFRGLSALTTAMFVIDSLKEVPGHKNLVIISGGIPVFEIRSAGIAYSNITYLLNQLGDKAVRAGVVINTLDPRGLQATPGVVSFTMTPGRSAMDISGPDPGFGRGGARDQAVFGAPLAGGSEHLGLGTVADLTGGVSVVNTNNFEAGLEKILAHSNGYYVLAYTPAQKFDQKFHKLVVKVRRPGARVFHHSGYAAREDMPRSSARTKEEEIAAAARSPLARRDIDITPNVTVKPLPENKASIDIHLLIDATKLNFTETRDKFQTSLDVVGFVFDQIGRQRGGFSETINMSLSREDYLRSQTEGLTYSASTELPPGYYQVRLVVRESGSGSLGTFSKYLEVPDLTKGRLTMSSLFLYAVSPHADGSAQPEPLLALRKLARQQDVRYAALVYNPKLANGKPQLRSQCIVSQGGKVLFREPEKSVALPASNSAQAVIVGQFGISKVKPGRYILTLIVTDTIADKKSRTVSRSIDFMVAN